MKLNKTTFKVAVVMAAALSLGAARSFGETLIAKVPFDFRLEKLQLPSGEYTISQISNNGVPLLLIRNWQARQSALIVARNSAASSTDHRPRMVFQCGEAGCTLSEIWGATAAGGVKVTQPHDSAKYQHAAFVYLKTEKNAH